MNELWEVLLKSGLSEQEINTLFFTMAQSGSPYFEVADNKICAGTEISVNPYLRMIEIIEPFLEQKEMFHLAVKLISQMDCYRGYHADTFRKEQMQQEIERGCFGEQIALIFANFSKEEKNRTLSNLLKCYRNREQIYGFVQQMQLLFPGCVIFRKRMEQTEIFVYIGKTQNRENERKAEFARKLYLPRGYKLHIAWDKPYLLTDMNQMHAIGNSIQTRKE